MSFTGSKGSTTSATDSLSSVPTIHPIFSAPRTHHMCTHAPNNIFKPKILSDFYLATTSYSPIEPQTVGQALNSPEWQHAMHLEHQALLSNHTWELVPPSPDQNVVSCKWVF